jgi:hypothetical protein
MPKNKANKASTNKGPARHRTTPARVKVQKPVFAPLTPTLLAHAHALTAHALALSAHAQALSAAAPPPPLTFRDVLNKLLTILAQLNGNPDQDIDPNLPISTVAPDVIPVLLQSRIDQDIFQSVKVFPISLVDIGKTATQLTDSILAFSSAS